MVWIPSYYMAKPTHLSLCDCRGNGFESVGADRIVSSYDFIVGDVCAVMDVKNFPDTFHLEAVQHSFDLGGQRPGFTTVKENAVNEAGKNSEFDIYCYVVSLP